MGELNLKRLTARGRPPRQGDVFAMLPPDGRYLFGRVIRARLPRERAPMPGANMIYVYRHRSETSEPSPDALTPDALLLPPLFINHMPWTKGYFETVGHWPIERQDLLARHCFLSVSTGRYLDEEGKEVSAPVEPIGDWGLHSYRTLDDAVSEALGLGLAAG